MRAAHEPADSYQRHAVAHERAHMPLNENNNESGDDAVRAKVREGYGPVARECSLPRSPITRCFAPSPSSSCGSAWTPAIWPQARYSPISCQRCLKAATGLSCGNPTCHRRLEPGQVVLDLGQRRGVRLLSRRPKVDRPAADRRDMTPDMLSKARRNDAPTRTAPAWTMSVPAGRDRKYLPLADGQRGCVISTALSPSARQAPVFREIARVLRPAGRSPFPTWRCSGPFPRPCGERRTPAGLRRRRRAGRGLPGPGRVCGLTGVQHRPKPDYMPLSSLPVSAYQRIARRFAAGTSPAHHHSIEATPASLLLCK